MTAKERRDEAKRPIRLYLGGPADGKRIPDPPDEIVIIEDFDDQGNLLQGRYRHSKVQDRYGEVLIRACHCVQEQDVLKVLVANYNPDIAPMEDTSSDEVDLLGLKVRRLQLTSDDLHCKPGYHYVCDLSNMSRAVDALFSAPKQNQLIRITVDYGNDDYELVIRGEDGVTINEGATGQEWSRLFTPGETITLGGTSETNWMVINDGRIPHVVGVDQLRRPPEPKILIRRASKIRIG